MGEAKRRRDRGEMPRTTRKEPGVRLDRAAAAIITIALAHRPFRETHEPTPNHPDKGKMNGRCNRTACQSPLNGTRQWSMVNYSTGGRLYYCDVCAWDFTKWDRRIGDPIRCSPVVAIPEPEA